MYKGYARFYNPWCLLPNCFLKGWTSFHIPVNSERERRVSVLRRKRVSVQVVWGPFLWDVWLTVDLKPGVVAESRRGLQEGGVARSEVTTRQIRCPIRSAVWQKWNVKQATDGGEDEKLKKE